MGRVVGPGDRVDVVVVAVDLPGGVGARGSALVAKAQLVRGWAYEPVRTWRTRASRSRLYTKIELLELPPMISLESLENFTENRQKPPP